MLLLVCALGFILRASSRQEAETHNESPSDGSVPHGSAPDIPELGVRPHEIGELVGEAAPSTATESIRTVIGLVLVAGSAWFVVTGAERIAEELNLTGGFVGFTLVAIGTSAPELFTAIAAARRGEIELLIGNLLGSNMFNSLAVGG